MSAMFGDGGKSVSGTDYEALRSLEERRRSATRRLREGADIVVSEARKFIDAQSSGGGAKITLGPFLKKPPCVCPTTRGHNNGSTPSRMAKPCSDACAEDGEEDDNQTIPPEAPPT